MRKSGFVLLAMGLGAVGVFVACSSSNNSGGGSGSDGGGSSSGASSGGYSLLNCPSLGSTGITSACASCVTTNCSSQLSSVDTACAAVFNCACPAGADASACGADETQACATALSTVSTACSQCNSECGSTSSSSSSGGSSSGSSSGTTSSSSSSSSGGASCDGGVDFTFMNVDEWCDITISGTIASSGGVATTSSAPSVSLCVQPDTTVTLMASPNSGYVLPAGFNDLLDGGIDPGTDAGSGAIQTTVAVGDPGNRCAWICCPGSSGSQPCPTTTANCPE